MKKILSIFLVFLGLNLHAVDIPKSSDILRQVKPLEIKKNENNKPKIKIPDYKPTMKFDNKIEFFVVDFKVTNNTLFTDIELLDLIKDYKNKKLTFQKLNEAVSLITKHYQSKSYLLAKAYIPVQKVDKNSAIIEISIKEGFYGDFTITRSHLVDKDLVQKVMLRAKDFNNGVISTNALERQMLILGDFGGIALAEAEVMAGIKPGTTDFKIPITEDSKYFGTLVSDNYGSLMTGKYSYNLSAYINSLSGIGDVLGISYMTSNTQNLKNKSITYSIPIGLDGLSFNTSFSNSWYLVGGELKELEISGVSNSFNFGFSYPLIKTKSNKLDIAGTYSYKDSTDKDNYQPNREKRVDSISLSISNSKQTSFFQQGGMSISSLTFTSGKIDVNEYAKSLDVLDSIGSYSKLGASLTQIQSLTDNLMLIASLSGQIALDRNLDGGEDFSVGGSSGVKAYSSSELSGDSGYLSSLEFSYSLPIVFDISNTLSLFIDYAKVWDNKNSVDNIKPQSRQLSDIGIGYSFLYDNLSIKTTYARGIGVDKKSVSSKRNEQLFIQLSINF
jgi:hemolysin activation/secretion protein